MAVRHRSTGRTRTLVTARLDAHLVAAESIEDLLPTPASPDGSAPPGSCRLLTKVAHRDRRGAGRLHESGGEPWASSGSGALEPDLPGRLARA